MDGTTPIYLLLGSNLGNKARILEEARNKLVPEVGKITRNSAVYSSPPWGFEHSEDFLNQVLEVNTKHSPHQVLEKILEIENILGRKRTSKADKAYEARTIDIDILYFGDRIINSRELIIPHPKLQERRFALIPLCEIIPQFVHPVLNVTQSELLEHCKDKSSVYTVQ